MGDLEENTTISPAFGLYEKSHIISFFLSSSIKEISPPV
jgi:hypothetical protein